MKILHVIPYFIRATKTGGPAQQLERLVRSEQLAGAEPVVVASAGNMDEVIDLTFDGDAFETQENGIRTAYLRRESRLFPPTYYYAPALRRWLSANLGRFDVAVIHGTWTYFSWAGAQMCQKAGTPYLIFVHGSLDPWALNHHRFKKAPYWHLLEKPGFKKASGIVALSQDEADQVRAMGIEKPTFLARNGLLFPLPRVADPDGLLATHWPTLGDRPFVYFMSRLHPKKGLEVLLRAWSTFRDGCSGWRLVIAGPDEGGYLERLLALVEELGLQHSVLFPGLVQGDVKAALLQKASLFVLPSFSEGVPGSVTQALAYGLPVLITPGCHLPEVAEAQAGLIVEPETQRVADGLERLMCDSALRQQMGRNAEQLARDEFDETKMAAQFLVFCESVLEHDLKHA